MIATEWLWQEMPLYDSYFLWLAKEVDADLKTYSELLYILYELEFEWCFPLDSGRAEDGLELRYEFYKNNLDEDWIMFLDDQCSVFEAIVGIARRMNFLTESEDTSDRTRVWFWELISNLGLRRFNNNLINIQDGQWYDSYKKEIIDICKVWMRRKFNYDGVGSLFPLNYPNSDQRLETIYSQLNFYVSENNLDDF